MRKVSHENKYNGRPLSESWKNNQGYYVEILQALEALFEGMISRHGRVFFAMYVLRYPAGSASRFPDDNTLLLRFLDSLMHHCRRKNYDPKYLWARELSPKTGQVHYHLALLLDFDRAHSAQGILSVATELWRRCLGIEDGKGLIEVCKTKKNEYGYHGDGIKIRRNDPNFQEVYDKCYKLASYLAKRYSKDRLPAYANAFGCSRICRDNSI